MNANEESVDQDGENVDAKNYKKTLCTYFLKSGKCNNGEKCTFAHGQEELIVYPQSEGDENEKSTIVCKFFSKGGHCAHGDNCKYVHIASDTSKSADAYDKKSNVCSYFSRNGVCKNGDSCKFIHYAQDDRRNKHDKRNTVDDTAWDDFNRTANGEGDRRQICKHFLKNGKCNNGENCKFLHQTDVNDNIKFNVHGGFNKIQPTDIFSVQVIKNDHARAESLDDDKDGANPNLKTKDCYYFKKNGHCSHGDKCGFVHMPEERRASNGGNEQENDDERHICRYFSRSGTCPQGDKCNFLHLKPSDRRSSVSVETDRKAVVVCTYYQKSGHCANGDNCKYAHLVQRETSQLKVLPLVDPKNTICSYFSKNGLCKNGNDCKYAHVYETPFGPTTKNSFNRNNEKADEIYDRAERICVYFAKSGFCTHGDNCKYSHLLATGTNPVAKIDNKFSKRGDVNNGVEECKYFRANGRCSNGDRCPYLHISSQYNREPRVEDNDKSISRQFRTQADATVPCKYWNKYGKCDNGDQCTFLHSSDKYFKGGRKHNGKVDEGEYTVEPPNNGSYNAGSRLLSAIKSNPNERRYSDNRAPSGDFRQLNGRQGY
eukprot:gene4378-6193_t